jgi:hypothetical protein
MKKILKTNQYEYGFNDKNTTKVSLGKGVSVEVIKQISKIKNEPK